MVGTQGAAQRRPGTAAATRLHRIGTRIASIKWVGEIEVSDQPLFSPWNTQFYRYFGAAYPPEGSPPLTRQVVKSTFELPLPATLPAGRTARLSAPGRRSAAPAAAVATPAIPKPRPTRAPPTRSAATAPSSPPPAHDRARTDRSPLTYPHAAGGWFGDVPRDPRGGGPWVIPWDQSSLPTTGFQV
jgi:hypothetical protein